MTKLDKIKNKITKQECLPTLLKIWRQEGKSIVFTNGCFDIIHPGHINYLSMAADLGDKLIIGLNSDDSVKRLKGKDRPLQDENSRALILAALSFTSSVVLFTEDTPLELISMIRPDVLVKGGDYKAEEIVGYDIVRENGGKVVTLGYLEGFSASGIIGRIG
jgi:D-glycero-beta-D-manno-heptose 1-phosphate adenylyltransferase